MLSALLNCNAQPHDFHWQMEIWQNDKKVPLNNGSIKIKKSTFVLEFVVEKGEDLFVSVALERKKNRKVFSSKCGFPENCMAIPNKNEDSSLILHDESVSCWLLEDDSMVKFDKVQILEDGRFRGYKTISYIDTAKIGSNENPIPLLRFGIPIFMRIVSIKDAQVGNPNIIEKDLEFRIDWE